MLLTVPFAGARPSSVLSERGWREFAGDTRAGQLSVKCMFGGRARYEVPGGRFVVDDASYLVLNHGRPYAIRIRAERPMESFCVFFAPGLVEDARRALTASDARLLDEAWAAPDEALEFHERLYAHDDVLSPALLALRADLATGPAGVGGAGALGERVQGLAERLLRVHRAVDREVERVPAARRATRVELYRRVYRARDFLDASVGDAVTLADAAAVALLSPHHFLRQFTRLLGETPHQYLTRRRLERARALLAATDLPVTRICLEVGFESPASFSTLFRRAAGVSPSAYRRAHRKAQFSTSGGGGPSVG